MPRRRCDALAYMGYYGKIPGAAGQHAIYARPISADLPDNLTGKVAHGWSGTEGSAVTKSHRRVLRERLPQGIGEPWLHHSQPRVRVAVASVPTDDRRNTHVIQPPIPGRRVALAATVHLLDVAMSLADNAQARKARLLALRKRRAGEAVEDE